MLSMFFTHECVYYNFDDLLQIMLQFDFQQIDKKILLQQHDYYKHNDNDDDVEEIKQKEHIYLIVLQPNKLVYCKKKDTSVTIRNLTYHECYLSLQGVIKIVERNMFVKSVSLFHVALFTYTHSVMPKHPWFMFYTNYLRTIVNSSFKLYFKILEQYILNGRPNVNRIGCLIDNKISLANQLKPNDDCVSLLSASEIYDSVSALMLRAMS
ncbi:hypothetical protein AYR72_gp004 [Cnaphalocrocis medinalis granulovirus]|uniref:Uncharacterized protein n=2 Tax=Cnaphalocrocis medinalis granulovirus TaxID=1750712 RepID=A0A109X0Y1_9BBAC|nr:hypothetical protein AYR72_gp004 [Cnaphalocrocis medinalis granulovirus]AMF83757.1 hypothetical protein [Cnaphalocrocis medinalis granulovirus]